MRSSSDFAAVIKQGKKYRTPRMVIHVLPCADFTKAGLTQVGFVVSKKVGNSVVRHRVVRQLRHGVRSLLPCAYPAHIVVRALPESARASFSDMAEDMNRAWKRFHLDESIDEQIDVPISSGTAHLIPNLMPHAISCADDSSTYQTPAQNSAQT